jgi:uncharacterized membrane protein
VLSPTGLLLLLPVMMVVMIISCLTHTFQHILLGSAADQQ